MMWTLVRIGFLLAVFFYVVFRLVSPAERERDDSDPPNGYSYMNVYTDNLTGCQYFGKYFVGITPRMNANGKQVCGRAEQ